MYDSNRIQIEIHVHVYHKVYRLESMIMGVTRKFQATRTKGKKNPTEFVSKNDKNAKILATFKFLHYAHVYTVRIGRYAYDDG